jgi:alkylated DNA repair dioxygenase AlkB
MDAFDGVPISYVPNWISNPDEVFKTLWNELDWVRHENVPRREYYCSSSGEPYTYGSGRGIRTYCSQPWHPLITKMTEDLALYASEQYEVVFLNGYDHGLDHLGWHADDSPEMDDARSIAIISLGAERDILFRPNNDTTKVTRVKLQNGSLCLMHPGMQDSHMHRIPKSDRGASCPPRISLTFRGYVDIK